MLELPDALAVDQSAFLQYLWTAGNHRGGGRFYLQPLPDITTGF
jgi:hypothetical protein